METYEYLFYAFLIIYIIAMIVFILYVFGVIQPNRSISIESEDDREVDCDLEWDQSGNLSRFVCQRK